MSRFDYYDRLGERDRATYRRSDAVTELRLPRVADLRRRASALEAALAGGKRSVVERTAGELVAGITRALGAAPVRVVVRATRPKSDDSELHGLYTSATDEPALIEVWMRTAAQKRVVAFRTFLRTLLHEVVHHLDLVHLGLDETFHTEGFFRRESSLVRQLAPARSRPSGAVREPKPAAKPPSHAAPVAPKEAPRGQQLELFSK